MVFEFPKSKYAYYILMVTTEVRHKCYCSKLVEWVYGYLFGGKKIWLLNKTQLVQKKTQKIWILGDMEKAR